MYKQGGYAARLPEYLGPQPVGTGRCGTQNIRVVGHQQLKNERGQ